MFTDAILTFTENAMRGICTDLDAELVEFNGEADHLHLLVAYPPTLAITSSRRAAPLTQSDTRRG